MISRFVIKRIQKGRGVCWTVTSQHTGKIYIHRERKRREREKERERENGFYQSSGFGP